MTFQELLQHSLNTGDLFSIVDNSKSASDIVRSMGHTINGRRITQTKKFLISNDIDITHWSKNGKVNTYITKECPVCNIKFTKPRHKETATCGYSCSNTYFRSGIHNPNWKDNADTSYRKKALSHYGTLCNKCGYNANILALEVHHKDKDRTNNSISNLEVLCSNCHAIEHYS